jgi:DNA repair exonuclease SbcCD ATPase subunit
MTEISEFRKTLERYKAEQTLTRRNLKQARSRFVDAKKEKNNHELARELVKEISLKTQRQLQVHIGDITSMALEAAFPDDPYELKVEFVERRNKTECDLYFERNGQRIEPMDGSGGGAIDVASMALRVVGWCLHNPKKRPLIVLDEPIKFLSKDRHESMSLIIKEISDKLGIQFIIVTHEEKLTTNADAMFSNSIESGVSEVKKYN